MNAVTHCEEATDEELVRDARAGSLACFEELVRRYQVPLLRFLQQRSPRPMDAEDVVQETFLRAFQSLNKYDDQYRFKTWLFTIAYRLAISTARGTHPIMTIVDSTIAKDQAGPDEPALQRESREKLWDLARRTLNDEQYAALWLHYVEDASPREIATMMGRSWVWVRTALHRAKRKLARALQPSTAPTEPTKPTEPSGSAAGSLSASASTGGSRAVSSAPIRYHPQRNAITEGDL